MEIPRRIQSLRLRNRMTVAWYVLKSKPRKEKALFSQIKSRSIECFFPRISISPVNPRSAKVHPYFPGYMFVNADLSEVGINTFQWMPFSTGLVSFDGDAAPVPNSLIFALKRKLLDLKEKGGIHFEGLEKGTMVIINDGPFKGYKAIFDSRVSGSERVRVLLQLLRNDQLPLELAVGQISVTKRH